MSKISITPNASGTGVFTISSPATSTDRTLTLPDEAGSIVVNTATGIDVTGTVVADGLTVDGVSNLNGVAQIGGSTDLLYLSGKTGTHAYVSLGASSTAADFFIGADAAVPLIFRTAATERMRIDSSGNVLVGKTSVGVADVGAELRNGASNYAVTGVSSLSATALFGRNSNDGDIIILRQDNTTEGTISVSGTTVSYNGGHLARWSQLADNTRDDTFLKGTVLTNLDQMASWLVDAVEATYYTEDDELPDGVSVGDEKTPAVAEHYQDNEQLNCMAVSSVEGDSNVAGVFVNWDNDDDEYTNDMNIAMTGDMIIRIAQGTTVARGDLLMSAGDGTAKPQGDDIVRAKTIAKVTSTHVTCTYDDGSYCVPCVLMAC